MRVDKMEMCHSFVAVYRGVPKTRALECGRITVDMNLLLPSAMDPFTHQGANNRGTQFSYNQALTMDNY